MKYIQIVPEKKDGLVGYFVPYGNWNSEETDDLEEVGDGFDDMYDYLARQNYIPVSEFFFYKP
jgi:hypothetical protein